MSFWVNIDYTSDGDTKLSSNRKNDANEDTSQLSTNDGKAYSTSNNYESTDISNAINSSDDYYRSNTKLSNIVGPKSQCNDLKETDIRPNTNVGTVLSCVRTQNVFSVRTENLFSLVQSNMYILL